MELFDYEKEHLDALRSTLAECTVLLKKDGSFPLSAPCKLAAFGSGVRKTVKGGTGSGEVNSRYSVNIEAGLENAGFEITSKAWLDLYDAEYQKAKALYRKNIKKEAKAAHQNVFIYGMGKTMLEPEYSLPLDGEGDTAIYVLSRISGEGNDRYDRAGDVKLTETEIRDILALNEGYEKFMLVLNVGGVVDLGPVLSVKNILLLSQLGVEIGTALADILLGKANPSGKLTTSWAAWEEYAPMDDFEDVDETRYKEGIYVGYRYFSTFGKKTYFPFGYGLSYTDFDLCTMDVSKQKDRIEISLQVKNCGKYAGKEVAQAYLTKPYGKLDQPALELCAFEKTNLLEPGESQTLTLSFALSDFASYDSEQEAYLLEAGDYFLSVGRSSESASSEAILRLNKDAITLQAKNQLGSTDFEDLKGIKADAEMDKERRTEDLPVLEFSETDFETDKVNYDREYSILPEVEELSPQEAALLNIGGFDPDQKGLSSIIGEAASHVCGAAGETCSRVKDFPYLVMADGPAGLRLAKQYYKDDKGLHAVGESIIPDFILDITSGLTRWILKQIAKPKKVKEGTVIESQYCTAIPIGSAIAQSFNLKLAETYGDIVGSEMERFGIQLWLAPALNIHRSIRCGRNFEYYSEDPLVSGKMAGAITRGVQKHDGCATTIKHFAANNKELNRYCNDSMVSERAMREIYLKGFGICVRETQPHAIMTSYNLLNGKHTAEHRGLIEGILRAEFGFRGIVMTDWVIAFSERKGSKHCNSQAKYVAAAGGDLFMPGGKKDYKNLLEGLEDGTVSLDQVKINASRVISMARKLRG